jgi:L-fucose mutarotase
VSDAVLSVLPLAVDVAQPAAIMHVCHSDANHRTEAQQAVITLVQQAGFTAKQVEAVERYAFYEKIKGASLIVQTGEGTAYGNAMFCKGVILL